MRGGEEKETAVREWCIEKAILLSGGLWEADKVIACAKKLEAYIWGKNPLNEEK